MTHPILTQRAYYALEAIKAITAGAGDEPLTVNDRAALLSTLGTIREVIDLLEDELKIDLVDSMELDKMETPYGWLVRSDLDPQVKWRNDDARDAVRPIFVDELATNPETGEVIPALKRAVLRTMDLMERTFSMSNPKAAFRKELGLDPDEFREVTPRGKTVKLVVDPQPGTRS